MEEEGGDDGDERGGEKREGDGDGDEFSGTGFRRRCVGNDERGNVGRKSG